MINVVYKIKKEQQDRLARRKQTLKDYHYHAQLCTAGFALRVVFKSLSALSKVVSLYCLFFLSFFLSFFLPLFLCFFPSFFKGRLFVLFVSVLFLFLFFWFCFVCLLVSFVLSFFLSLSRIVLLTMSCFKLHDGVVKVSSTFVFPLV